MQHVRGSSWWWCFATHACLFLWLLAILLYIIALVPQTTQEVEVLPHWATIQGGVNSRENPL